MQRAAAPLLGEHDFVSFEAAGSERESTVRTLSELVRTGEAILLALVSAARSRR